MIKYVASYLAIVYMYAYSYSYMLLKLRKPN